ncbi:hypothetical protein YC2023_005957 [Brassica napus]
MFSVIVDLDWFGDLHVKFWLILIENRRKQTKPTEVAKLIHVLASEAAQMVLFGETPDYVMYRIYEPTFVRGVCQIRSSLATQHPAIHGSVSANKKVESNEKSAKRKRTNRYIGLGCVLGKIGPLTYVIIEKALENCFEHSTPLRNNQELMM